jgi:hypothetical protein
MPFGQAPISTSATVLMGSSNVTQSPPSTTKDVPIGSKPISDDAPYATEIFSAVLADSARLLPRIDDLLS